MKLTIIFAGLLGVFLTPALASSDINIGGNSNSGASGQQSVSVNNEHNVANVDNNNGWDSWHALWDYNTNFAAIRLFGKKKCVVHRMNKNVMPSLQTLDTLIKEKKLQGKGPEGPPPKGLMYSVNPEGVKDLNKLGKPIANMCRGIPTYMAEEIEDGSFSTHGGRWLDHDVNLISHVYMSFQLKREFHCCSCDVSYQSIEFPKYLEAMKCGSSSKSHQRSRS